MADEEAASVPPSGMNLGGIITQKIIDQIKNMDVMTVLTHMMSMEAPDEESNAIKKKLQNVIQQYNAMSDADKVTFSAKIKEGITQKLSDKLQQQGGINLGGLEETIQNAVMNQLYLVGAAILIFVLLLVFFGYKLFKSIMDKEKRKEEKKKAKQMKKKK